MRLRRQAPLPLSTSLHALRRPLQRIAAFGLLPATSLLSSLILLPIISARFGQAGWSSVLLGQSIGAAASVVCALAWPMEGADLISRAAPALRRAIYRVSVRQRAAALAAATPVVIAACLVADPSMPLVCVLSSLALALNALSPGWYFVGTSRPSQLLVAEGGPRILAQLSAIALVAFVPLWSYPIALIVGMLVTLAITAFYTNRSNSPTYPSDATDATASESPPKLSGGRLPLLAVLARGADAASSYMAPPLVALVAGPAYPLFAAVDKLNQTMLNGMSTVTRGLTAWIAEANDLGRRRRLNGAVLVAFTLAGVSLSILSVAIPFLLDYVFAGTVEASPVVALLAATIIAATFLLRTLSLVLLVPQGRVRAAYWLLIAGACVGLPAIALAARLEGAIGALVVAAVVPWGQVAAQLGVGLPRRRT